MIAYEVRVNGKKICIAGAGDLSVLSANVTAAGKLGPRTMRPSASDDSNEILLRVGGLTGRLDESRNVHLDWTSFVDLSVGDVVQIKVIDVRKADRPRSRRSAKVV